MFQGNYSGKLCSDIWVSQRGSNVQLVRVIIGFVQI